MFGLNKKLITQIISSNWNHEEDFHLVLDASPLELLEVIEKIEDKLAVGSCWINMLVELDYMDIVMIELSIYDSWQYRLAVINARFRQLDSVSRASMSDEYSRKPKKIKISQNRTNTPSKQYLVEQEQKWIWQSLHGLKGAESTGHEPLDNAIQKRLGGFHDDPMLGNFRTQNGDVPVAVDKGFVEINLFGRGYEPIQPMRQKPGE